MRVRLEVKDGAVGVAVAAANDLSTLIREVTVDAKPGPQEINVSIPDLSAADSIIVRNTSPRGSSHITLTEIGVYRPDLGVYPATKPRVVASATPVLGPLLFNVPLSRLEPANNATAATDSTGLQLATSPQQWSYSLVGRLQDGDGDTGPATVRVRLEVKDGAVGVAVAAANDLSTLIREVTVDAKPGPQEIDVAIPDLSAAGFDHRSEYLAPGDPAISRSRRSGVYRPGFWAFTRQRNHASWRGDACSGPLLFNVALSRLEPAKQCNLLQRIPLGCSWRHLAAVELQSSRPTAGRW